MRIIYKSLFLSFVILMFASCAKSEIETITDNENSEENVVMISEDSYMSDRRIAEFHGDPGKYLHLFEDADVRIGIASFHYEQTGQEKVAAFFDPRDEGLLTAPACGVRINGKDFFSPETKSEEGLLAEMFGQMVEFDFAGMALSTKGAGSGNTNLYAPVPLRIAFPRYDAEKHWAPLCYDKDFVVRWNADTQNQNGVLVVIKWDGAVLFGEDYESSSVIHSMRASDTGKVKLDNAMFEGIPDTAYCTLFLFRGDIENIDVDHLDYQLLVETHDMLNFVLVKNVHKLKGK